MSLVNVFKQKAMPMTQKLMFNFSRFLRVPKATTMLRSSVSLLDVLVTKP